MDETSEQIRFPQIAQDHIRSIGAQIEGLQAQMQQFIDGLIIGLGVDVNSRVVSVDLSTMTATVTDKATDA